MKGVVLLLLLVLNWQCLVLAENDAEEWGLEGEVKRELVVFSDRNFEHDTQAATGQTTGAWIVLFVDRRCEKCTIAEKALLEATTDQQPIPALVNVLECPKIRKRFAMTQMPQLRLFRDRRMFVYEGEWNAASISAFIQTGWKEAEAQEVPPEASALSEYMDDLETTFRSTLEYLGRRPGILVAIGGFFATFTYAVTLRILGLTPKSKKNATRSRIRPVRKRAD